MTCALTDICGGCLRRGLGAEAYQRLKCENFEKLVTPLKPQNIGAPIFIGDSTRRRATFAFQAAKGKFCFGFNRHHSKELVDISTCPLLSPRLNNALPDIRALVADFAAVTQTIRKGKKLETTRFQSGDVSVTEAFNGIDVLFELPSAPSLEHRMLIFEKLQSMPEIIRLSFHTPSMAVPEPIVEKTPPYIDISGYQIFIPAGTFLQPSVAGQEALINLVMAHAQGAGGPIADLFCGVGTFSYPLSRLPGAKIVAIDSSPALLEGFRRSVNKNQITNINVFEKNLFKYPLDAQELKDFGLVVFDPPRAGALAQVQNLAALPQSSRPKKIIAVSCNPETFVRDAKILQTGGYLLQQVTLVDQFIYSDHSEVVALFTNPQG